MFRFLYAFALGAGAAKGLYEGLTRAGVTVENVTVKHPRDVGVRVSGGRVTVRDSEFIGTPVGVDVRQRPDGLFDVGLGVYADPQDDPWEGKAMSAPLRGWYYERTKDPEPDYGPGPDGPLGY